ncbi:MAG TPA: endolytic transglycosylase MltG, partial [Beijerinckiaceae bacterium]|nr:endolytic transglycosylase MltG [Beijerinckiaceae bacterium]
MADNSNPPEEKQTRRRSLFSPRDKLKPVAAPPPPPRPKRKQGGMIAVLSAVLTVSVIILVAATAGIGYVKRMVASPGPLQTEKSIVIERGAGAEEIAELLEREGIITQPTLFQVLAMSQVYGRLKAGEFLFKREASLSDVIDTIANGRAIEHTITIPEGLTSEQIVARLKESDLLTGEVASVPREGALLPDTYRIARGTSRDSLLARMEKEQKRVLGEVWNKRAKDVPLKSPSDLVILASVVEKETGKADERSRVAGVFVNRLNRNMRLQSDPTIVYGLVGGKGTLGRGITRADIQSNTPYNTYVINGLPPGPIANPGRASLEAAANPSRTRELFFVADGTGGHAFSETLEQHERNVARWRQIEAQRDSGAAPGFGAVPLAPGAAPS